VLDSPHKFVVPKALLIAIPYHLVLLASSTIGYQKASANLHEFASLQMLHGLYF
jgi:hypothetical protein